MLALTSGLSQLRPHYTEETSDLFRILLNATPVAEADLALEVLKQIVPEKPLVTACNLREVLAALPASPFVMRVDEETLCKTARLEKQIAVLKKHLPGDIELVVTTAGNLVLDIIVRHAGKQHYWTPIPVVDDFINPEIVDLVVTSGYLLDEVIDLAKCMGIVFNPKFYLSLEDWYLEYASEVMAGIEDIF
jgi:hypothetical protein